MRPCTYNICRPALKPTADLPLNLPQRLLLRTHVLFQSMQRSQEMIVLRGACSEFFFPAPNKPRDARCSQELMVLKMLKPSAAVDPSTPGH